MPKQRKIVQLNLRSAPSSIRNLVVSEKSVSKKQLRISSREITSDESRHLGRNKKKHDQKKSDFTDIVSEFLSDLKGKLKKEIISKIKSELKHEVSDQVKKECAEK